MEILTFEDSLDLFIIETINMLLDDYQNASINDRYILNDMKYDLSCIKRMISNNNISSTNISYNYAYKSQILKYIEKFELFAKLLKSNEYKLKIHNKNLLNNFIISVDDILDYLNNIYILISLN